MLATCAYFYKDTRPAKRSLKKGDSESLNVG